MEHQSVKLRWGIGDFAGGQATKKFDVYFVVIVVETVGLVLMVVLALLEGEPAPAAAGLWWAATAGLVNGIGW